MKKIILALSTLMIVGCKSKSYDMLFENDVIIQTDDCKNIKIINLKNYDFYKHEKYFSVNGTNFIKTTQPITNGQVNRRYEIVIMAIEKESVSKSGRNVIYFSYIPPYRIRGVRDDKYRYEYNFYDNKSLINLNDINYIQFGKLNNNTIQFIKETSISLWSIEKKDNDIKVIDVTFTDRGEVKTVSIDNTLKNSAIYQHIDSPLVILHHSVFDSVNETNSDYLIDDQPFLHYDIKTNNFYFNFKEPLVSGESRTWIMYSNKRVRANYVE